MSEIQVLEQLQQDIKNKLDALGRDSNMRIGPLLINVDDLLTKTTLQWQRKNLPGIARELSCLVDERDES